MAGHAGGDHSPGGRDPRNQLTPKTSSEQPNGLLLRLMLQGNLVPNDSLEKAYNERNKLPQAAGVV